MNIDIKDIFNNNYSALCNYANVIVKDKHIAEDIVQSIFIQLWEHKKLEHVEKPEPYLMKCVRYKCLDYLKSPNRKKEIYTNKLPDINQTQQQTLNEEDILPILHYFASKLPSKMQRVFLMSRQQGMTYKEIAQDLDISVKTVENQMGTALKKLRILLRDHHYLPALLIFFQ